MSQSIYKHTDHHIIKCKNMEPSAKNMSMSYNVLVQLHDAVHCIVMITDMREDIKTFSQVNFHHICCRDMIKK